jgi:hypothetical protein
MRYAGEPTFHLGGWAIGIYQVLFICAGVIRLVALALFMRRIPDER